MEVARVKLIEPFTPAEAAVVELLGADSMDYRSIGKVLKIAERTVEVHVTNAAKKVPGTVPQKAKLVMWYRGRSIEDLHAWKSYHRASGRRKCECGRCDDK